MSVIDFGIDRLDKAFHEIGQQMAIVCDKHDITEPELIYLLTMYVRFVENAVFYGIDDGDEETD